MNRINNITPADRTAYMQAEKQWNSIAKPLGSLGELEKMICKIASIQGDADIDISRCAAAVFCGDHGVTAQGVTQCGNEVTAVCARDIAEGRSNINAEAAVFGAEVIAVDLGISQDVECEKLINKKISRGTHDITLGPAMTEDQAVLALTAGMDTVCDLKSKGFNIIVSGEMGIGNTASAATVSSVLLDLPAEKVTGRGAGLSSEGLERKIRAVQKAVEINKPYKNSFDILQKLGGFEIAGMTGLFLGGAFYHIPVIIDGVISAASAALAYGINPLCGEYMLASHCSEEPAAKGLLDIIGMKAVINAGLRLGEGTGGMFLVPLLRGAEAVYKSAHKFEEISMERYAELK